MKLFVYQFGFETKIKLKEYLMPSNAKVLYYVQVCSDDKHMNYLQ